MTKPITRPDPANLLNSVAGSFFPKTTLRIAATAINTYFLEKSNWDFTPEHYGLDKFSISLFSGANAASFNESQSHENPPADEVSSDSGFGAIGAYTKDVVSQHPKVALASTITALTCLYSAVLGRKMPNGYTRVPLAFFFAYLTTYTIANYAFGSSAQDVMNATVNVFFLDLATRMAVIPTQLALRITDGALNAFKTWPGAYSSVRKKQT